jgi:3,4-dihydroxy 2-butanone 4-phosphate synthase/GTP cyclohydrolase II
MAEAGGFAPVEEAIEAIAAGKLVIVVDSEDRENEGDLVCAAEKVTPEMVNFMLTYGRGLLCVSILPEVAHRLRLRPMVEENTAPLRTAFTVSVDHVSCRTGISAFERAKTIRALADPTSAAEDFVRPGHIFPLVAKEGGVLRRAGHTEASVDLCRLAGLRPCAALCEVLDTNGEMARGARLFEIAGEHGLLVLAIEDLIRFRRRTEKLVRRTIDVPLVTQRYGRLRVIVYEVAYEDQEPFALVKGDPSSHPMPLVRMHSSCFTGDLLASLQCDCGDQLHMALDMIHAEGCGVVVYLPQEGRGIGRLSEKLRTYQLQRQGLDTVEANQVLGYRADRRDYGIGAQILKDLGLSKIRLLTNNPKKIEAINFLYRSFDLQVVDQIPIVAPPDPHRARYLDTKREKLGHLLPDGGPTSESPPRPDSQGFYPDRSGGAEGAEE